MAGPIVLIGTGTSVGKTHVAERLLRALSAEGHPAIGYKPVESGFSDGSDSDIARLGRASTFHVKPPLASLTFAAPVSPHLAARLEGREIDLERLRREVARAVATPALAVIELPGGAFSPMSDRASCVDFARSLPSARVVLIATDRLGVLHEVAATARACAATGLPLFGIVLNAPERDDASTGTNAGELRRLTSVPVLCRIARGLVDDAVAEDDPARALARLLIP